MLTLLALFALPSHAADYAVPSVHATVQDAVNASLSDTAAVILVDPAYVATTEPVVSLAGWSGATRSATPSVTASVPALHGVDGVVTLTDLRIGLAPAALGVQAGITGTGSVTAADVTLPGLTGPGPSVAIAMGGPASLSLTRADISGHTAGAIALASGTLTLVDGSIHDNNLGFGVPSLSMSAGINAGPSVVGTITGTSFAQNTAPGLGQAAAIYADAHSDLTLLNTSFGSSTGTPIVARGPDQLTVDSSAFTGTTAAAAGALYAESPLSLTLNAVDVSLATATSGAVHVVTDPASPLGAITTTLQVTGLHVADATTDLAGIATLRGDIIGFLQDLSAARVAGNLGTAGLHLEGGLYDIQTLSVADATAGTGGAIALPVGTLSATGPVTPGCPSPDVAAADVTVLNTSVTVGGVFDVETPACMRLAGLHASGLDVAQNGGLGVVNSGSDVRVDNATGDTIAAAGNGGLYYVDGWSSLTADGGSFSGVSAVDGGLIANISGDASLFSYDAQSIAVDRGGVAFSGDGIVTIECAHICDIAGNKGLVIYNDYRADTSLTGSTISDVGGVGFEPTVFEAAIESSTTLWVDGLTVVGIAPGISVMDDTYLGGYIDFYNSAFDAVTDGVSVFGLYSHGNNFVDGNARYCSFVGFDPVESANLNPFDQNITPPTSDFASWVSGVCDPVGLALNPISELIDSGDPLDVDSDGSPRDIGAFGGPGTCIDLVIDADGDGSPSDVDCNDDNASSTQAPSRSPTTASIRTASAVTSATSTETPSSP